MESKDELYNSELENILAEAVERLEIGEAPDAVVQSYPEAYKDELQDLLMVIDVTTQYAADEIPLPPMQRRSSARKDFLNVAAEFRKTQEQVSQSVGESNTAAKMDGAISSTLENGPSARTDPHPTRIEEATQTISRSIFAKIDGFLQMLVPISGRFAPIAIGLLMLVLFSTASAFTVAWASIPGDLAYPLKEWARRVGLELVPVADRPDVMRAQEKARAEEVMLAQEKADRNSAVIQESLTGIFHGYRNGNGSLDLGATIVIPRYQPDANQDDLFLPMEVIGDLLPGSEVQLDYQIIPGQQGLVQGIRLTVLALPTPTPIPTIPSVIVSTNTPANLPQPACTVSIPGNWVAYRVQPGDSLSVIAARFGVQQGRLQQVNCLVSSGQINAGTLLYVPPETVAPPEPVPPTDTVVPFDTATSTATVTVLASDTATPSATFAITSTSVPATATATISPTTIPETAIVTAVVSPTIAITLTATPEATTPPTATSTVPITGTNVTETDTPEPDTPEPDGTPTPEPDPQETAGNSTPDATSTPGETAESTTTPGEDGTPFEVTVESSPVVITSLPAETATPESTSTPTLESSPTADDGASGDLKTATIEPSAEPTTAVPATDTPAPLPTETPIPSSTETPVPTDTSVGTVAPVETATTNAATTESETVEATETPTATDPPVPLPTDTPVPLPTDTPIPPPTDTPIPPPTDTPIPSPTDTPVPPPTDTPVP